LRPQEAFGLKWADLDDGWLHVQRVVSLSDGDGQKWEVVDEMKTDRSRRRLKLSDSLLQVLERHRARQAEEMLQAGESYERKGFVFTRSPRSGEFLYHEPVRKAFNAALKAAGLPQQIRVYDLRHTHISQLIIDGGDLKKASVRAGHSTIKLTANTYAHLSDESEEEMADATEAAWGHAMGRGIG
jgi:integrase